MDRKCSIGFLYERKLLKAQVVVNQAALSVSSTPGRDNSRLSHNAKM
ncbi:hypothetical protein DOT_5588 [Desulfosporosinus sp. OT]|nr:hypothetical protein DOT_5588 [Desulfosporosinus sp. OT]